ncbi:MAG: YmdB family metallophosphoesterase, partial [Candidatus Hydrogenedentes bacterium]|nr:YmdB family metallophosphoesterase [Candidatus Hydrogenedentota bacterium]
MKILFIGDIVGRPGRDVVRAMVPKLCDEFSVDFVIANAENAAGGLGVTPDILDALFKMGVHGITLGNHTWRRRSFVSAIDRYPAVVRPANYPDGTPGHGATNSTKTTRKRAQKPAMTLGRDMPPRPARLRGPLDPDRP